MKGKNLQSELVRKMLVKRPNVEHVLKDSNVTPFLWYKGKYRCFYCAEIMKDTVMLMEHTAVMHQSANLELTVFDRTKNNRNRDAAVKIDQTEADVTEMRCKLCPLAVNSLDQLTNHLIIAHDAEYDVSVPECELKHKERDHPDDDRQILCHYCSKECKNAPSLKQHLRRCKMRNVEVPEETMQPNKKRGILQVRKNIQCILNMSTAIPFRFFTRFSCFHCSKHFVEFDELKSHVVTEHPVCDLKDNSMKKCKGERFTVKIDISELSCKVCYERLDNLDDLIDHLITKHHASYDKSITECFDAFKIIKDNIPCNICSSVFRYFGSLVRHINSEHSKNNKICEYCGRNVKTVGNLNVHIQYAHTGACKCEFCGAKYKNQWCLARHKATSHNVKEFQCPKCDERFQSLYHKQRHMINAHEIGHKCTHCGKMFTRNSFMKDHIRRTHLKEKNVQCPVCNEKFFDNYLLKLHMVRHKGERNFSCEVCGKAFLRRRNLKSHKERCTKSMGMAVKRITKI